MSEIDSNQASNATMRLLEIGPKMQTSEGNGNLATCKKAFSITLVEISDRDMRKLSAFFHNGQEYKDC